METFVDIISDIGAQISKSKRCRINQQTLIKFLLNLRTGICRGMEPIPTRKNLSLICY